LPYVSPALFGNDTVLREFFADSLGNVAFRGHVDLGYKVRRFSFGSHAEPSASGRCKDFPGTMGDLLGGPKHFEDIFLWHACPPSFLSIVTNP
jgi:hypothetical protein